MSESLTKTGTVTLIIGGARSGKSAHALSLASRYPAQNKRVFVATAEALDDEIAARIARHRETRPSHFVTIEEPIALPAVLAKLHDEIAVIDSLTIWVSNLLGRGFTDNAITQQCEDLSAILKKKDGAAIVVSDEVGMGIVPENPVARRFRDLLGTANQIIAGVADEVVMMAAGYPIRVK
jgi:adenosylcobinamide kinase/adenosylcobinamide-phosphate guanylyltransferase